MTGYELRLWRKGLGWSRDKAAEQLDISLRTYKDYENAPCLKRSIALATVTLSLIGPAAPDSDRTGPAATKCVKCSM